MNVFELEVTVRVKQRETFSGLTVHENFEIEASGFMEVCEVLAQFHKLAETFKRLKGKLLDAKG